MRWLPVCALLLLLAAFPAAAQDGGDDSGIEEDSQATGPEEPEKPAPKPARPAQEKPPEKEEPADGFRAPTAEEINAAIGRGVEWLKKAQKETGTWGPCVSGGTYGGTRGGGPCYNVGPTAFSIFVLATCGVPHDDPGIRRGLAWLDGRNRNGYEYTSYESSAVILMFTALNGTKPPANGRALPRSSGARPPKGVPFRHDEWSLMDVRVRNLLECFSPDGGFGYWDRKEGYADVSATQFAILALREASFAGYPVEKAQPDVWTRTAKFLGVLQAQSGGFPYHNPYAPTRGMTSAAVSSLLICREQLGLGKTKEKAPAWIGDAVEKGLAYLDANFDLETNPSPHFEGRSHYHYAYLYALERTGVLSARREFAGKDWYVRGAAHLLAEQAADGHWRDKTCMDPEDTLGTCFALLFLKRATPPAVTVSGD